MTFLSESAIDSELLEKHRGLSYCIEQEKNIDPAEHHPERYKLLPKLISDQLRVLDTERFLKERDL